MSEIIIKTLGARRLTRADIFEKTLINPKFGIAVRKIRKELELPPSEELLKEEIIHYMQSTRVSRQAEILVEKFGIPKTWKDIVQEYIVTNYCWYYDDPDSVQLETRVGDDPADRQYYLHIFPNTSLKDIKEVWPLVQKELNPSGKKTKKIIKRKLERDLEIYYMHKDGATTADIYRAMRKMYPQDGKDGLDFGLIKAIVSSMGQLAAGKGKK